MNFKGAGRIAFFNSFILMRQISLLHDPALPSFGPVFVWPGKFEPRLAHRPSTVGVQAAL